MKAKESKELGYGPTCAIKQGIVKEKIKVTKPKKKEEKLLNVFDFVEDEF